MADEKEIEQKYMQFQMLQQQMEQINEHLQLLNQQNQDLEISINSIEKLKDTEADNEILCPIANGIFLKAKLQDNQKLIVNVGSGVTVEKTIDEVIKLLEEQKTEMKQKVLDAEKFMQELNNQAMKIYQEVESLQ